MGLTRSSVWLPLKGEVLLRVEWVPEEHGREEEQLEPREEFGPVPEEHYEDVTL